MLKLKINVAKENNYYFDVKINKVRSWRDLSALTYICAYES